MDGWVEVGCQSDAQMERRVSTVGTGEVVEPRCKKKRVEDEEEESKEPVSIIQSVTH